jgi:cytochrome bd ubiquinol oxidase subunit II
MPGPDVILALVVLAALAVYAVSGGADFGGGFWDLLARGERAQAQRRVIAHAIGPIWEANHVWLILVVVLLFVAFPPVFALLWTVLHIPMTLMLMGIVLRGSAFVFRSYGEGDAADERRWSRVFAVTSTITPVMLGITLGAAASGRMRMPGPGEDGDFVQVFLAPWLAPFPIAVGVLTLALFAFLAAVYLTLETDERPLVEGFRRRALLSAAVVFVAAWVALFLARRGAPHLFESLLTSDWALPFQTATGLSAVGAVLALWWRRYGWARILAVVQVGLIVVGWGLAQYPYLVVPYLTVSDAAAAEAVLWPILLTLGVGGALLLPSFVYLFVVFKGHRRSPGR